MVIDMVGKVIFYFDEWIALWIGHQPEHIGSVVIYHEYPA